MVTEHNDVVSLNTKSKYTVNRRQEVKEKSAKGASIVSTQEIPPKGDETGNRKLRWKSKAIM